MCYVSDVLCTAAAGHVRTDRSMGTSSLRFDPKMPDVLLRALVELNPNVLPSLRTVAADPRRVLLERVADLNPMALLPFFAAPRLPPSLVEDLYAVLPATPSARRLPMHAVLHPDAPQWYVDQVAESSQFDLVAAAAGSPKFRSPRSEILDRVAAGIVADERFAEPQLPGHRHCVALEVLHAGATQAVAVGETISPLVRQLMALFSAGSSEFADGCTALGLDPEVLPVWLRSFVPPKVPDGEDESSMSLAVSRHLSYDAGPMEVRFYLAATDDTLARRAHVIRRGAFRSPRVSMADLSAALGEFPNHEAIRVVLSAPVVIDPELVTPAAFVRYADVFNMEEMLSSPHAGVDHVLALSAAHKLSDESDWQAVFSQPWMTESACRLLPPDPVLRFASPEMIQRLLEPLYDSDPAAVAAVMALVPSWTETLDDLLALLADTETAREGGTGGGLQV